MQVVWSLNQLAAGKTFGFDAWGKEIPDHEPMILAGGWRAIWSGTKGDQVYIKKALCLSTSCISKEVCYHCKRTRMQRLLHNTPTTDAVPSTDKRDLAYVYVMDSTCMQTCIFFKLGALFWKSL